MDSRKREIPDLTLRLLRTTTSEEQKKIKDALERNRKLVRKII